MKLQTCKLSCFLLAGLMASPILSAESIEILRPGAGDLAVTQLQTPREGKSLPAIRTESVNFAWALAADRSIDQQTEPHRAASREYSLSVTAADLQAGVAIPTTAAGAFVRLNPVGSAPNIRAIDPKSLILTDPQGSDYSDGRGMISPAGAEAMKSSGVPFAEGTSAFRIDPVLGDGLFILRLDRPAEGLDTAYQIHVFEKSSSISLSGQTDHSAYLEGSRFSADFNLEGSAKLSVDSIDCQLVTPGGQRLPVEIRKRGASDFVVTATLEGMANGDLGLWEIHASVVGQTPEGAVRRDVHTAFAVATPTARFVGRAEISRQAGLTIDIPVEAEAPGRYEARGVLFGTDPQGSLRPLGIAHSANWLPQGVHSLSLSFGTTMIEDSGLTAPFEIRDLQLLDQGRVGLLHRQARGLVLQ